MIPKRIIERKGKDGLNVIFGVSKGTIERNVLQPLREIYGNELITAINSQNIAYLFGEEVYCLGCEKANQVSKIQGTSIKYAYGDEIAKWCQEVFIMIQASLDKPYSCFDGALNPESNTHWFKTDFLDTIDEKGIDAYVQSYTIFDNQAKEANIIATFKKNYKAKELSSEEKIFIINFIKGNKDDLDKCKNIIKDFMSLIEHLNNIKKNKQENDSVVKGHTKIVDILKNFDFNTSNEFLTIFDEKNKFTINKVFEIFYNYLLIIFDEIKGEIRNYQENIEVSSENQLNEKSMEKLDEFFQKQNLINPEDLEIAIKLFITLVLFREKDKENKIKFNRKNIVDYLKQSDFWNDEIYSNEKFNENLEELKLYNIKINNIMMLYDFLVEKK